MRLRGGDQTVTTNSDSDGDGLTDIQEYNYGLDPTAWSSANNGIPDGWALRYGFDPTLASVANLINANGNTTLQNYLADLNPTNAASRLAITGLQFSGGDVSLTRTFRVVSRDRMDGREFYNVRVDNDDLIILTSAESVPGTDHFSMTWGSDGSAQLGLGRRSR